MTPDPVCVTSKASLSDAAASMRDTEVGAVIVRNGDSAVVGVITDRDITVRATAAGRDPDTTTVGDCCSSELLTVSPDDSVEDAIEIMRRAHVRRLPVVDGTQAVGILSLGDLAVERDRKSVLGEISAAEPNP
jgi:CBS domain-containing protein